MCLQGCATSYHVNSKALAVEYPKTWLTRDDKGPYYVENPDLSPEYEIFRESGRFEETLNADSGVKIRLNKIERELVCGNPLLASFITLGILPVGLPSGRTFSFTTEIDGTVKTYSYYLGVESRSSIWEWPIAWLYTEQRAMIDALRNTK